MKSRPHLFLIFGSVLLVTLIPLIYLISKNAQKVQAEWFHGDWQYRKVIPVSSHTSAETNVYIAITSYDASDTTKYQSDCGDVRFTKYNGELLPYTVSTCGASTTFNVLFDSFPAGAQDIYIYYGNTNAPDGFQTTAFSTQASSYAIGTTGSESTTPGPVGYWKFDEGQGQTINDQTKHAQGTLGATSGSSTDDPTWKQESDCISGKCLLFDGGDLVNVSTTVAGVQSVGFWVKPTSTSASMVALNGSAYITASSGTITATGFTGAIVYVNGISGGTLVANTWQYVEVTSTAAISASAITIGTANSAFTTGFIDDVKIYPYTRTAAQVKLDYNQGAQAALGGNTTIGGPPGFLSNGLVGYWKLDESSGNAADSSGNGLTLTNNATTTYVTGKFSNGSEHVPASLQYLNTATTIAGVKTVSFWVNPDVTGNYYIDLDGGTNYISDTAGTLAATGFTSPSIYINGAVSSTVTANVWQLVTITTNTAISASAFAVGKIGSNYFDGTIDDVRIYNRTLSPTEVRQLYSWAPGPVGYWNFNEKTGQSASDTSGNSNTGTLGANSGSSTDDPTWTTGKIGGALNYDGSNDYVSTALTNTTNSFTWSAWVYPTSVSKDQMFLGQSTANSAFYFRINGSKAFISTRMVEGSTQRTLTGTTTLRNNQWWYLTATYDGSYIRLYVNGSLDNTSSLLNETLMSWGVGRIGRWIDSDQRSFVGSIDDVRIYSYTRTPQQIVEDMNAGHPIGGSPVGSQVIKYGFDEQQGITANNDVSANSTVTGSVSGATWKTKENCKLNGCLDYDGTDDVTTITNATTIDLNDNLASGFTASAWIYPDTAGEGSGGQIFYKGTNTWLRVDTLSGGKLDIQASLDLATTDATLNVSAPITQSAWNHVALSYTDDADDEITIWVNGVAVGTSTDGAGAPAADTGNLLLGGTTTDNFDGKIDEFKLYSSELTKDQINIDNNLGFSVTYSVGHDSASDLSDGAGNPPVAYWNFNEKTGTAANDTGGNNVVGTLGGTATPTWVNGKIGSGLSFTNGQVTVSAAPTATTNGTIEAWVKVNSWGTNYDTIVMKGPGIAWANIEYGLIRNSSNSQFLGTISNGTSSYNASGPQSSTINLGAWYHLVFTWDSAVGGKFYTNGVLTGTYSNTTISAANSSSNLKIGKAVDGSNYPFKGIIDQVKIYNYTRTPAQVAYDYNRGAPVGWWQLDECSGITANDISTNSYTGTITIGALGEDTVGTCTTSSTSWGSGATGKYGASLSLDGSDDSISVADTANLRFDASTADFSLFAWVKRTTTGTEYILSKEDADNDGWRLMFNSSNQVVCSEDSTDVTSTLTITNTSWHLVGCTIDRDGNGQIYIDGKADGATVSMGTDAMATTANLTFGTRAYTATSYLNGQIDDIKIFNYALSPAQVKKIMNEGSAVRFGN